MSESPQLTESSIRGLFSSQSFDRGRAYCASGAVSSTERRGNTLSAEVEGSEYEPYRVTVELDEAGIASANCTCPYDWSGYCKHIAAVLLAYIKKPEQFAQRQPVDALLHDLDRDALLGLLTDLLNQNPSLIDWVEIEVSSRRARAQAQPLPVSAVSGEVATLHRQQHAPLDPQPFRRRVRTILRSMGNMYDADYEDGDSEVLDQLGEVVDQARPFIQAGDGRNALVILEEVVSQCMQECADLNDMVGDLFDLFSDLSAALAEAILTADLSPQERKAWSSKLAGWQAELDEYSSDAELHAATAAVHLGWDDPLVKRLLRGEEIDQETWQQADEAWGDWGLPDVYLNVLQWQGRTDEFLNLARETGQDVRYATKLIELGRGEEAAQYGLAHLLTADEALALAQALRDHGLPRQALQVGERGLSLPGSLATLARWLRDLATGLKENALALRAAQQAFGASLGLDDYKAVQALAGAEWSRMRGEMLQQLENAAYAGEKINIYLHEGMVDQAVQTIDKGYWGYDTLEKVVDAATQSHPDWVIRQCKKQAEPIMDQAKSQQYHHAVRWLEKARQAYRASGRDDEWRSYISGLLVKHARKRNLMPGLEQLR